MKKHPPKVDAVNKIKSIDTVSILSGDDKLNTNGNCRQHTRCENALVRLIDETERTMLIHNIKPYMNDMDEGFVMIDGVSSLVCTSPRFDKWYEQNARGQ